MKKVLLLITAFMLVAAGCNNTSDSITNNSTDDPAAPTTQADKNNDSESEIPTVDFSNKDYNTEEGDNSVHIEFNKTTASCNDSSVQINNSTITITKEGTYIVSGILDDGTIVVDAPDTDKIHLILDNAEITSKGSAPIYVNEADKIFITLKDESTNILTNGGSYDQAPDSKIDGVIFSRQDLTINGNGKLTIDAASGHGIVCKDDLVITGGNITIDAASHGIDANDSVGIDIASITINCGKDGIHVENSDDDTLGNFLMKTGSLIITCEDDGIHASASLTVNDGKIDITKCYEGLESTHVIITGGDIKMVASDDGINAAGGTDQSGLGGMDNGMFGGGKPNGPGGQGGGHGGMGGMGGMSANSNGSIKISGGNLYINSSGDGIDANGTLEITGGYTVVSGPTRGDTATLDYDVSGVISGGTFIGTGASGMAQTFSNSANQGVISVSAGNQEANTRITLTDSDGNTIIDYSPELPYAVVILSSPQIVKGETYTLTVGELSGDFEAT